MIKRLLVCLFLLVPITAQAEIVKDKSPDWITKCWSLADGPGAILVTFESYGDRPGFVSESWIKIDERKTGHWTWIFSLGDLICKMDKILE